MSTRSVARSVFNGLVAAVIVCCALAACGSTSNHSYNVPESPLDVIETAATEDDEWTAHRVDGSTLELRKLWLGHSVVMLGLVHTVVDLRYDEGVLRSEACARMLSLFTLYIPWYRDAKGHPHSAASAQSEEGMLGWIRGDVAQVLDWGEVPNSERPPMFHSR